MSGLISIFLKGVQGKTTTLSLKQGSTIDDLFNAVNVSTCVPHNEIRLIFGKHELKMGEGKKLEDFKMKTPSTVFMVLRLNGGINPMEMARAKKGNLRPLAPFIKVTSTMMDMISLDDDPNTFRAVMPCGHAIGPASMTSYCQSLLSTGHYTFLCPEKSCQSEWPYFLVRHVACLSPEEQTEFETKIAKNYIKKQSSIRQCPGCTSYCERKNKSNPRVVCTLCSKQTGLSRALYEFCWNCLRGWMGADHSRCGTTDQRLDYLARSGSKTIVGVDNCPALRACPNCGILIEHVKACKHMDCKGCNTSFCFICLKPKVGGRYQCGAHNARCVPAPVQTKLPGA